jgi:hypothetical protein
MISRACVECRLPVGSSASSSAGAWTTARAMPTSCCCPPESCEGNKIFLGHNLEAVENVGHHPLPFFGGQVLVRERQVDVLGDGQVVQQVIALEDHADALAGEVGALLAIELVHRRFAEPVLALPAVVEQRENVEQRRLPAPDGPITVTNSPSRIVIPMRRSTQVSVGPVL